MLTKSSFRKTKRGKIVHNVREHYLRDDIWCGCVQCGVCNQEKVTLGEPQFGYFPIFHSSVLLNQIDLLENNALKNCIILQTSLDEVKNQSLHIYNRIKQILSTESRHWYLFSNEYNRETHLARENNQSLDEWSLKVIQKATFWYKNHFVPISIDVRLIVNEPIELENKDITVMTISEYIKSYEADHPELIDLLIDPAEKKIVSKAVYEEHLPVSKLKEGIKSGKYHQGVLHTNQTNCFEGFVRIQRAVEGENGVSEEEEILISGKLNLNRGIDSDIVVIELLPKSEWKKPSELLIENENEEEGQDPNLETRSIQSIISESLIKPCAKVVGIIKRNWKPMTGRLIVPSDFNDEETNNLTKMILFLPADSRIPKIRIKTRQLQQLVNKIIVVSIDEWNLDSFYPQGHFVKQIGECGDEKSESEALLIQFDIPYYPFPEEVTKCLPEMPWKITELDRSERTDLTQLPIVSIDPPGCTDIDDALHVRMLPNGNYEVGVHIADVTHFVKFGTAIDTEASLRGNTVYLVDQRIDMLPKLLGENLCSLRSNVERFAFSVLWEVNPDTYEIIDTSFTKSIIHSKASFTYEEAQMRIDDANQNDEITKSLRLLNKIAKTYRQKRIENGALTLASIEVRIQRRENDGDSLQEPTKYETKDTNALVEEFMLLANTSVAKKIYGHFPHISLLRRHPAPPKINFENLAKISNLKNLDLNFEDSKKLAESLDSAQFSDSYLNTLLRILTTRSMLQAVYFCSGTLPFSEYHHYGLAEPIYTHFTSPIRRYADVVVHRLLAAALNISSDTAGISVNSLRAVCDNLNRKHNMARYASMESTALFTMLFFKDKVVEQEAYVTKIKANGFIVLIPKYGIENIIYTAAPKQVNNYIFNELEQTLESKDRSIKITLMQHVRVKIFVEASKATRSKLRVVCLDPFVPSPFGDDKNHPRPKVEKKVQPPTKKAKKK